MAKVLVMRLSALGDVAMLVPVIASVAERYPQDRFYVLTRVSFVPLFQNLSFNVSVIPLDVNGKHKGLLGLLRIAKKCMFMGFSHVADEHDVLRSKVIRWAIKLTGRKVRYIDKGRAEKKAMVDSKIVSPPLKSTIERYRETFDKLGFPADLTFSNILDFAAPSPLMLQTLAGHKTGTWVGVAPFARHQGKMYPLDKMEKVVESLIKEGDTKVFLLGAGAEEKKVLEAWSSKYSNVVSLAGKLNLEKELQVMSHMDVVISMDSANMHLASLVQVPVVSIWGATHPSIGFYGFRQDLDNAVQIDHPCRPCSVFGDVACQMSLEYECMKGITEQMVLDKVYKVLSKKEIAKRV